MPKTKDGHFQFVDALRGVAVLGVVLVHTAQLTQQTSATWILSFTGQRGVQLFYMLSAFTLCMSMDNKIAEPHALRNYFIRRFFRIAPLFYVVILVNLLLKYISPAHSSLSNLTAAEVLMGFLFINGAVPAAMGVVAGGWSIAVETTFYVLLPFLHRRFNTIPKILMLFGITAPILHLLSKILAIRMLDSPVEQYFIFLWFPVEFPVFVLGMLTYAIWKQFIKGHELDLQPTRDISGMLLFAAFMMYCACLPFHDVKLYFSSFLFLPLILSLSIYRWSFFVNRVTSFIGTISYSVYLLHFFALSMLGAVVARIDSYPSHLATRLILNRPLGLVAMYLAALGISIPLSALSQRFIELPGIDIGRRLIAHSKTRYLLPEEQALAEPGC